MTSLALVLRPKLARLVAALGVMVAAVLVLGERHGSLTTPKAVLLGAVEGITEYLPVSSTGHLLVAERLVGLGTGDGKAAADTYTIAIQIGAIGAVLALYRHRIVQLAQGLLGRDEDGLRLLIRLVVAFLPAACVGLVFGDTLKEALFGPWPVIAAWIAGGLALIVWYPSAGSRSLEQLTVRSAALIGTAQLLALWPGVSRSLVTIVAALLVGCDMVAALEFSFLLGLATLTGATVLDLARNGDTLLADYGWRTPLLGALVAFATALVAVRWLVAYLRTRPLAVFGWYRLAAAVLTIGLIAFGAV